MSEKKPCPIENSIYIGAYIDRECIDSCPLRTPTPDSVGDLLATIHRDGGHYEDEVGTEQAAKDALIIVSKLRQEIAERPDIKRIPEADGEVITMTLPEFAKIGKMHEALSRRLAEVTAERDAAKRIPEAVREAYRKAKAQIDGEFSTDDVNSGICFGILQTLRDCRYPEEQIREMEK